MRDRGTIQPITQTNSPGVRELFHSESVNIFILKKCIHEINENPEERKSKESRFLEERGNRDLLGISQLCLFGFLLL